MEVLIKLSDAIKTLKSMAVPLVRKLPSAQPERLTDYSFEESCTECPAYDTENHRCPRFNQVIRTALKDANLEPCENCISRQAALNALDEQIRQCDKALSAFDISMKDAYAVKVERASLVAFRETLEYMPSVQPEKRTEKRTETHACDCISRAEAIELKPEFLNPNVNRETKEQTAIDRAYARGWNSCNTHWIKEIIEDLPSAQPEIIRCKDCKHWRQQTNYQGAPLSFGFCESDDMWRSLYGETYEVSHIDTDDDFYCGHAERRTDEQV